MMAAVLLGSARIPSLSIMCPRNFQLCFPIIAFFGVEGHPSCLDPPENFSQSLVVFFDVSAID